MATVGPDGGRAKPGGILAPRHAPARRRPRPVVAPVPLRRDAGAYSRTTVPPAASSAALIFSASSLDALALISCGRDSTSFFACGRDKVPARNRAFTNGINDLLP